jgi:hypothetical protein
LLVVAAAFTPVRRALEGIVERRFPAISGEDSGAPVSVTVPAVLDRPEVRHLEASRLLSIGSDGTGGCSLEGPVQLTACLRCDHLRSFVRDPEPAVVCAAPASPAGG